MKNILLIIFTLIAFLVKSQTNIEYSEPFTEPVGWTKLIQIRNGNTALVEITKREGIHVTLYGADRKVIINTKLPLTKIGSLSTSPIPAILDIDGNLVIFVLFYAKSELGLVPTLYRVVVNGKTGELTDESEIYRMNPITKELNLKIYHEEIGWPNAYVEKDPEGDSYALMTYNTLTESQTEVKVFHYTPNHSLINNYVVTIPTGFNQAGFLAAYVKSDFVIVGNTFRNYIKDGEGKGKFVISKFSKDNIAGIHKELTYNEYAQKGGFPNATFLYNSISKNITMILANYKDKEGITSYYDIIYQPFNHSSMSLLPHYKADMSKVNDYYRNLLGSKDDFTGMIQGAYPLTNGNLAIFYQLSSKRVNQVNVTNYYWGDIGVSVASPDGKSLEAWAMRYNSITYGASGISFNFNFTKNGRKEAFGMEDGTAGKSWYYGMDFIATDNANYLFLNNTMENFEKPETEKSDIMKSIIFGNAIQYTFKKGGGGKKYLFGPPAGKKEGKYANFTASHYNPATKTYCTLMGDFKEKKQQLVWFKLD